MTNDKILEDKLKYQNPNDKTNNWDADNRRKRSIISALSLLGKIING
jgi:hypothetical protein